MCRRRVLPHAVCLLVAAGVVGLTSALQADPTAPSTPSRLTAEDAKKLKNPVPFSKASIARGRILFIRECTECHGKDGRSQVDVIANATDLTQPKLWTSGTSEGEVFRSIRDGAGDSMPPFLDKFDNEDDMWDLVNFTQSLWPKAMRPKLQDAQTD